MQFRGSLGFCLYTGLLACLYLVFPCFFFLFCSCLVTICCIARGPVVVVLSRPSALIITGCSFWMVFFLLVEVLLFLFCSKIVLRLLVFPCLLAASLGAVPLLQLLCFSFGFCCLRCSCSPGTSGSKLLLFFIYSC